MQILENAESSFKRGSKRDDFLRTPLPFQILRNTLHNKDAVNHNMELMSTGGISHQTVPHAAGDGFRALGDERTVLDHLAV